MSLTRTIALNTAIQVVGKVISTAIGLVVVALLTRYLGEEGFGRYTTIMVFLQLFGVIVDLGLYIILVKKISEPGADEPRIASNIFTLRLVSAIIVMGCAPLIAMFFPYSAEVKIGIAITAVAFFGVTLTQALTGIFQKHFKMYRVALAELAGRLMLLGITWWVVSTHLGLLWVMGAVTAGSVVNTLFLFFFSRSLVRISLAWDFGMWKEIIRDTWPIALSIIFNLVYFKADTLILSLIRSEAEVGVYGASYKVLEVLTTFPAMFAGLVLPLLTAAWAAQNMDRFRHILQKAFNFLIMLALPLIGGTLIVAGPVMRVVTGEGFDDAGALLKILMVATATIFVGNLFGNAVVAVNRQRTMMWVYLGVAIVSLVGYLLAIPAYSYFGAAWMTVVSELLVTLSAMTIVLFASGTRIHLGFATKSLIAAGLMVVTMYMFRQAPIVVLLVVGCGVYVFLLFLFRALTPATVRDMVSFRRS